MESREWASLHDAMDLISNISRALDESRGSILQKLPPSVGVGRMTSVGRQSLRGRLRAVKGHGPAPKGAVGLMPRRLGRSALGQSNLNLH